MAAEAPRPAASRSAPPAPWLPALRASWTFPCRQRAAPALAEEAIESFQSALKLDRDGTLHVSDTIRVRAEGEQIRRGIYYDISTTFEDAAGNVRRVGLDILTDGEIASHEGYLLRKIGNLLDLKPGYLAQARSAAAARLK